MSIVPALGGHRAVHAVEVHDLYLCDEPRFRAHPQALITAAVLEKGTKSAGYSQLHKYQSKHNIM
jgi:hypothetical protein